jgi:hypothetical protein
MNHPVRAFLFTHYWWLVTLIVVVAVPLVVLVSRPDNVAGNIVALCAGALGVVYFIQKQKLEELQLFERLFTRFNERYAAINADLQRIVAGQEPDEVVARRVLDGYFNLCAEEYLFYEQGRILPSVWRAWCRGMLTYLECVVIREYWEAEVSRDSHYGLTSEVIRRGAGCYPGAEEVAPNKALQQTGTASSLLAGRHSAASAGELGHSAEGQGR